MIINDIQEKYLKMVFKKKEIDSDDITVDYRGKIKNRHCYVVLFPDSNIVITTPKLYMVADIQKAVRALVSASYE